jgi:ribosomal-protein-alanine N-acetyltransferase
VRVVPAERRWIRALERGDVEFERQFRVPVEQGWDGFPETLVLLARFARSDAPAEWGPYLVFDEDGALVGNGGWKGAPVDGVAELGYAISPGRRNRGIATAMVNHLLAAAREAGLEVAVAHTLAAESASTRVLHKCGFRLSGEFVDPDDGPVWRWERVLTSAAM